MVRQMRREGQHIRRYQLAGFLLLELGLGIILAVTGSLQLLVWVAVNALFVAFAGRLEPPRRV
jgi:hypothetical protein